MKNLYHFPMPFCEEPGGGGGGGGNEPTLADILAQLDGKYTLDEILAQNKELQSQYDKKVTASNETVRKKTEEKVKAMYDDKLTEQEKLKNLNEEEKKKYEEDKKEAEFKKREAEITRRELRADALEMMSKEGVDAELIKYVDLTSAETVKKSIDDLKADFGDAVQRGVEKRIGGGKPPADSSTQGDKGEKKYTREDIAKMPYNEVAELKAKDPEGFAKIME